MNINSMERRHMFKLAKQICRENKLKEFHYKFLHTCRIIVIKKELCLFGIKQDSDCLYCGKKTLSSIHLSTANFQKLSSEELFNDSIT